MMLTRATLRRAHAATPLRTDSPSARMRTSKSRETRAISSGKAARFTLREYARSAPSGRKKSSKWWGTTTRGSRRPSKRSQ